MKRFLILAILAGLFAIGCGRQITQDNPTGAADPNAIKAIAAATAQLVSENDANNLQNWVEAGKEIAQGVSAVGTATGQASWIAAGGIIGGLAALFGVALGTRKKQQ